MLSDILRKKIQVGASTENLHQRQSLQNARFGQSVENLSSTHGGSTHHGLIQASPMIHERKLAHHQHGYGALPSSILQHPSQHSPPKMANMRVSTGGPSKLDTIKAFVDKANRIQMEQLASQQMDMQSCTIQQAEMTAYGAGGPPHFSKPYLADGSFANTQQLPTQSTPGGSNSGPISINVAYGNHFRGTQYDHATFSSIGTKQFAQEDQMPHMSDTNYQTFLNTVQGQGTMVSQKQSQDHHGADHMNSMAADFENVQTQANNGASGPMAQRYAQSKDISPKVRGSKTGKAGGGAPQIGKQITGVRLKVQKMSTGDLGSTKKSAARQSLNSLDRQLSNHKQVSHQPMFGKQGSSSSLHSANSATRNLKSKQQKLFSGGSSNQSSQPRLFGPKTTPGSSGIPMVRKSGASGLPKAGGGGARRPGSAALSKGGPGRGIQVTSYQLDACELIGNRLKKKLREYLGCIKAFAAQQEKAQMMGRYDRQSEYGDQYEAYNMRNNSSVMLEQVSNDGSVRRSLMDLPRKLADYQQKVGLSSCNRGQKGDDQVIIDTIEPQNWHERASVESHQIGMASASHKLQSPFSSIGQDERDQNARLLHQVDVRHPDQTHQPNKHSTPYQQQQLNSSGLPLNTLLNDRFEIESIRQEQGFFKQKLESIKNDIKVMKQIHEHSRRGSAADPNQYMQTMPTGESHRSTFLAMEGQGGRTYGGAGSLDDMMVVANRTGRSTGKMGQAEARQVQYQVCSAMQLNYYKRVQTFFSRWQLLIKLSREEEYKSRSRDQVQRNGGTETKLLLLKSMVKDRVQVRQKQALRRWRDKTQNTRQKDQVMIKMRQLLNIQKLLARKDLHMKWTLKAQHKLCFQKWKQQVRAGYF